MRSAVEHLIKKSDKLDKKCDTALGRIAMQQRQLASGEADELSSDDNEVTDKAILR